MPELLEKLPTFDLPYTIRLYGVSEEMFDEWIDEDTKAELIDGVMIVHSPASPRHNRIAGLVRSVLQCYAEERGLGQAFGPDDLVHLGTSRKFMPDGFFLEQDELPKPLPKDQFELTPALVFEVLSPSNRDQDLNDKRAAYRQAGVREIWLIDPELERVIVDRRRGKSYVTRTVNKGRITSAIVPGFWIEIGWLWAEPLPKVLTCLHEIMG